MRRLVLWAACSLVVAAQAAAPSVHLEDFTWTELRDEIRAGKTTILVPIGGTEQNGPHMALGKHNARVKGLAERIAKSLGNALVAPVVAYVPEGAIEPPSAHMKFPATPSRRRSSPRRAASAAMASATSSSSATMAATSPTCAPWRSA